MHVNLPEKCVFKIIGSHAQVLCQLTTKEPPILPGLVVIVVMVIANQAPVHHVKAATFFKKMPQLSQGTRRCKQALPSTTLPFQKAAGNPPPALRVRVW